MKKHKNIRKIIIGLIIIILIFIIQSMASKLGGVIANLFDYNTLDKDNTFLWITVHHLVQMIIALLCIGIIGKKLDIDFYLNINVNKTGIKYTVVFAIVILIYVLISYLGAYKANAVEAYGYELNMLNVGGSLGFQLLLSGTSEEILFRALPIGVLGYVFSKDEPQNHVLEIFFAAFLFSIAHISWSISPFTISFSWFQLIYAFVLGLIYGITYVKSRSIIYPIIMHGLSNFFMVGVGYIFARVMG